MSIRVPVVALTLATSLMGCGLLGEPRPDVGNPKSETIGGLEVSFPGNWSGESEVDDFDGVEFSQLTIESPGSALAVVQVFRPAIETGPDEYLSLYVENLGEAVQSELGGMFEVEGGTTFEDFSRPLLGEPAEGRSTVFELALVNAKVPARATTLHRELPDRSVIVIVQAPVEDWKTVEPGFELIYDELAVQ